MRVHPMQICQEPAALLLVGAYSYDVTDKSFLAYFLDRCGIDFRLVDLDHHRLFLISAPWLEVEEWILNSPELTYLSTLMPVPAEHRDVMVKVWKIIRGKLQDCWEVYQVNQKGKAA